MFREKLSIRLSFALGVLAVAALAAAPAFATSAGKDPFARPLWEPFEAHEAMASDTFNTTAGVYKSMSFQVFGASNNISDIFNELGGYDAHNWRFGHWRPDL